MTRPPLHVLVLSDGQPGHYNLSRGIVAALRRTRPVKESWVGVRLRIGLARNILRAYLNQVPQPASLRPLNLFCKIDRLPAETYDLIVSAGGKTSFANAWLAQWLGVPNVYMGSLRRLSSQLFSVVLTLEPIEGAASNLLVALPPSAIDFEDVQLEGARFRAQLGLGVQRCWTMMIGGNGAGYRYGQQDWYRLAGLMNTLAARYHIGWLLVGSRRTGQRAENVLKRQLDTGCVAAQCWYGQGDALRVEAYLGAAERVFVTEDSMTMLTESIYARRPVVSLRPRRALPTQRYARMMQGFADRGYLSRYALAELARQPQLLESDCYRPLEESPLRELGERLAERLDV